jgi:Uma2 family endonuclease
MAMAPETGASVEELFEALADIDGKAEIVNGEIVRMSPAGDMPGYAAMMIAFSLHDYAKRTGKGRATTDNVGFKVNLPNRKSFSPDAAFYTAEPSGMKFFEGAPVFAAEVRSEGDYGRRAEAAITEKRRDYFAAGTQVVWAVDLLGDEVVRVYRVDDPEHPTVYKRGEVAEAEPAVPGWRMPVDDLFED